MEKKLRQMMDYQRFENNPALSKIISDAESRFAAMELSDDDLSFVNAAGGVDNNTLWNGINNNNDTFDEGSRLSKRWLDSEKDK